MNIVDELSRELLAQDFERRPVGGEGLEKYREVARSYASTENAISVLSDMHDNVSYIYYGGFARTLGLGMAGTCLQVSSIWEENILKRVHPEDLCGKYLQELRFFRFVKRQPPGRRSDYYLMGKLRMRDAAGNYLPVLHRLFYVSAPSGSGNSMWLALCLYTPLYFDLSGCGVIVDSMLGQTTELEVRSDTEILSVRERQVLNLIDKGLTSKAIAGVLCISVNTVSRHRQAILEKLQVKNSIEACRIARDLGILS